MIPQTKQVALSKQLESKSPLASGLPAYAYTSTDYWLQEQQMLFSRSWVFVGFAHEISMPGDVMPVEIAGKPVFLIRDGKGAISAFHNVCRHRCLKLIGEKSNVGPRIRCPYHSWVYGLNGALKATPFFGGPDKHTPEGFNPQSHSLVAIHCEVWFDWVYINLSDNPEPFDKYIEPLRSRLADIDFDQVKAVATIDLGEIKCNWKLLMENFIEPYHVQFVHSSTTDQPLSDHYTVIDKHCLGSAVDIDESSSPGEKLKKKSNTLAVSSLYLTLFPNFVFGRYFPDQIGVHLNTPVSVNQTRQKRVIYISDGSKKDDNEIEALKSLWYDVHKEDHEMCERLQLGRGSEIAELGGLLSPHWEDSVRRFQEMALQRTLQ